MKVPRAHKIRIYPNVEQRKMFAQACGVSRLIYNWGLAEWQAQYKQGDKPYARKLKKEFNAAKDDMYPFVRDVAYGALESTFENLGSAYKHFFRRSAENKEDRKKGRKPRNKKLGYPRFKSKARSKTSFTLSKIHYRVEGKRIRLAKVGWVKMAEALRFEGEHGEVTVSRTADRWFASIVVHTEIPDKEPKGEPLGVDVGVKHLAITSEGQKFDNSRPLKRRLRKVKRLNRKMSRQQKGSKNREKTKFKLSKQHYKVACAREDAHHKVSHEIAKSGRSDIVVETLGIQDMMKNKLMSQALADASLYELKRQIKYKAEAEGTRITEAPRYYSSSKICSNCGVKKKELSLSERTFKCESCGFVCDRDVNAALNLKSLIDLDKERERKRKEEAAKKRSEARKKS